MINMLYSEIMIFLMKNVKNVVLRREVEREMVHVVWGLKSQVLSVKSQDK